RRDCGDGCDHLRWRGTEEEIAERGRDGARQRDAAPHPEDVPGAAPRASHAGGAGQALGQVGDEDRGDDGGAHATAAEEAGAEDDGLRYAVEQGADGDGRTAAAALLLARLLVLRPLAVAGTAAGEQRVGGHVDDGATEEADHRGRHSTHL